MKIVIPTDTTHTISMIPRFNPSNAIVLELYNEASEEREEIANTYAITNGRLKITFDYTFTENQKWQYLLSEDAVIVYRGKILSTTQDPQNHKITDGKYQ